MTSGNLTSSVIRLLLLQIGAFKHMVFWSAWLRGLTSRVFFVAHLKVDASVKLSRDQSIGHNHDQPWDGKQHQQDENVPEETLSKIIIHIVEYVSIQGRPDVNTVYSNFTLFFARKFVARFYLCVCSRLRVWHLVDHYLSCENKLAAKPRVRPTAFSTHRPELLRINQHK